MTPTRELNSFCEKTKSILILQVILKFFRKMVQEFMKIPLSSVHSKSLQRMVVFCILTGCTLLCSNKHVHCVSIGPAKAPNPIRLSVCSVAFSGRLFFFLRQMRVLFQFLDSSH